MKEGKRKAVSKLSLQGKKSAMKRFTLKHSRNFLSVEGNFADFSLQNVSEELYLANTASEKEQSA